MKNDPNCTLCSLYQTTNRVCVLGSNPKGQYDVMVVGEAPGSNEEKTGELFSGRSGQFLRKTLADVGIDDFFICNAVSCRPPDNRTPSKKEIKACKKWLDYQFAVVKPKYVLLLGNIPLLATLGFSGIRKARGKPLEKDGIIYVPTYHPAFILRDPSAEPTFIADIQRFSDIVAFGGIPFEREIDYVTVDTEKKVEEMIDNLSGTVSCDLETTGLYPWTPGGNVVSIGLGTTNKQYLIPVSAEAWSVPWTTKKISEIVERVAEKLEDCFVVGHNWKFDGLWLRVKFGIEIAASFDTMLAHYLVDENDWHSLDHLAQLYFGAKNWDVELTLKQGKAGKWEDHARYLAQDIYYTRKLRFKLGNLLNREPEVKKVFNKILMPCSKLFMDAEFNGVYVNTEKMDEAEAYLRNEVAEAEKELKQFGDINWGSPMQVADLFFGKLKIPIIERTKTGKPSTSESVIKRLDHPASNALLRYRGAKQQLSFFIEGWKPFLVKSRLHPSFKLSGTVTGRLSCEHPNFQQIPRDPRIRSLITAPPGWELIEADLSQIELRIAAALAEERNMLNAFLTGIDVHWLTALREIARGAGLKDQVIGTAEKWRKKNPSSLWSNKLTYGEAIETLLEMGPDAACDIDPAWKELRKKAKAVNFGYLYGMWWKKFKMYARDNYGVTVTDEQAQASREAFFALYPDFEAWHNRQRRYARQEGFVTSLSGRKRRLPKALLRENTPERQEAERQAINSPVQSFANELNLMAALQLRKEFPRRVMNIIGTVHDAILFEVKKEWVPQVAKRILEVMSAPDLMKEFEIELGVPLLAEVKIGPWASGKALEKWIKSQ